MANELTEQIALKLPHLPESPGVYLFKDASGVVLYVGKAKRLRSRVRSYFGADPLASGRVTLMGEMRAVDPSDRDLARERYLDANPAAAYYIEFGDFDFYRLTVQSIRYVGGYGRMSWVDPDDYAAAEPDPLVGAAAGIIEHMNDDHADAQVLFCRHYARRPDTTSASMSAVDRYGFEMIAVSDAGRAAVRLAFPNECLTATDVREAMVAMVQEARAAKS